MEYDAVQKTWCVVWYGMSGSPKYVRCEYHKKFGRNANAPDPKTIKDWFNKLLDTGSLNGRSKAKTKWVRTVLKVEEVLAKFREDPHISPGSLA